MTKTRHYTRTIDLAQLAQVATRELVGVGASGARDNSASRAMGLGVSAHVAAAAGASEGLSSDLVFSPADAYAVPFRVVRHGPERVDLFNDSDETVRWVTIDLIGPGHFVAQTPTRIDAGESLAVWLFGDDLARQTKLQVSWFRSTGEQYLWRVSL